MHTNYRSQTILLKAMAHPTRLVLLERLWDMELPVTALQDQTDLPQAVISQHLATLRNAGIVTARAHGTARLYHIADRRILAIMKLLNPKLA